MPYPHNETPMGPIPHTKKPPPQVDRRALYDRRQKLNAKMAYCYNTLCFYLFWVILPTIVIAIPLIVIGAVYGTDCPTLSAYQQDNCHVIRDVTINDHSYQSDGSAMGNVTMFLIVKSDKNPLSDKPDHTINYCNPIRVNLHLELFVEADCYSIDIIYNRQTSSYGLYAKGETVNELSPSSFKVLEKGFEYIQSHKNDSIICYTNPDAPPIFGPDVYQNNLNYCQNMKIATIVLGALLSSLILFWLVVLVYYLTLYCIVQKARKACADNKIYY